MLLINKRIFIVEDNVASKAILEFLLDQHGAVTKFAQLNNDTLAQLRDFAPVDVILLDLMLPNGLTGFNLFDLIRSSTEFDTVPVIAVSAAHPETAIPEAQARGFSGFINKPIHYNLFPQQLARIIAGETIWHSA